MVNTSAEIPLGIFRQQQKCPVKLFTKFPATSPDDPSLGDPPFVEQKDRERHFPRERTASVMLFIRLGCKAWKVMHV